MGKGFRVLEKSNPPNPYSVLLEQRNKEDTLLFESQAVAVLCTYLADVVPEGGVTLTQISRDIAFPLVIFRSICIAVKIFTLSFCSLSLKWKFAIMESKSRRYKVAEVRLPFLMTGHIEKKQEKKRTDLFLFSR